VRTIYLTILNAVDVIKIRNLLP